MNISNAKLFFTIAIYLHNGKESLKFNKTRMLNKILVYTIRNFRLYPYLRIHIIVFGIVFIHSLHYVLKLYT